MVREEALHRVEGYLHADGYSDTKEIIKALEQEECNDCISRQAVLDALDKSKYSDEFCEEHHIDWSINLDMAHIVVNELPPVNAKSKTGHWIYDKRIENWKCSECGCSPKTIGYVGRVEFMREHFKFCNHCGAKMIDVPEINDGKSEIPTGSESEVQDADSD